MSTIKNKNNKKINFCVYFLNLVQQNVKIYKKNLIKLSYFANFYYLKRLILQITHLFDAAKLHFSIELCKYYCTFSVIWHKFVLHRVTCP